MSLTEVRRNMVSAQLLARFATERGLSQAACLEGTGISVEALADPQTEIGAEQELRLARNLLRGLGPQPGLGLEAGLRYHLATYGIWGFALLSCKNFRAVAEVVERYLDLSYAFIRFRTRIEPGLLQILLDDSALPEDLRPFFLERDFAAWSNAMRELQPQGLPVQAVELRLPRPMDVARYVALCGVEPRFDAEYNRIHLDPALLDAPLPQGNALIAQLCLEQCRQLLEKRRRRDGIAGQVRERLFQRAGQMPSLDSIAAELQLAPRSLRRHLEQEGTSFRALADEVLETLAEELLIVAHMKLEEVAQRLGYAEPASFIHAFKRWKGVSPNAYREQRRQAAPGR
ncbi:AraC family transcriptional regulator [Stagnimonas aquatica]|uniref:AraC family transcriptional regulator n=1 Tax=Stagnimonas aquatica TaxID=2689987 RepID=UPI0018F52520|nr:AraC family transcriptional regulator [Stagnimonas aquatica]